MILLFFCFSWLAYPEGPPIYLERSLDLLWAVWSQFRHRYSLAPHCSFFTLKVHSGHQGIQPQVNCEILICCIHHILGSPPSLFCSHFHFDFWLASAYKSLSGVWSQGDTLTQGGKSGCLFRLTYLFSCAVEREGPADATGVCGECSPWLSHMGVTTAWGELCACQQRWSWFVGSLAEPSHLGSRLGHPGIATVLGRL